MLECFQCFPKKLSWSKLISYKLTWSILLAISFHDSNVRGRFSSSHWTPMRLQNFFNGKTHLLFWVKMKHYSRSNSLVIKNALLQILFSFSCFIQSYRDSLALVWYYICFPPKNVVFQSLDQFMVKNNNSIFSFTLSVMKCTITSNNHKSTSG